MYIQIYLIMACPGIPQPAVEVDHNNHNCILSLLNWPFHTITHYCPLLQCCLPFLLAVWTFPPPCVTVCLSLNPFESNDPPPPPPPTLLLWEALTDHSPFQHTTSHALHFHMLLHNTPPVATLAFLLSMLGSMGSNCLCPCIQNLAYVLTYVDDSFIDNTLVSQCLSLSQYISTSTLT
ncbi:hypothetical protein EV401DRAFT_1951017 [Pisolithus croceorrhizus]|nr:hypothetical protein EV401DRAFT_1951017 [Pisolithus croceorrhizus]